MTDVFGGKTLLITGGTGSFGNAMLEVARKRPFREIRIFSRDELKQEEMRIRLANPKLKFYIGDVRDPAAVHDAMQGVDYVFHAAALKQVPSCEFFPLQAVRTNILGSYNVIEAAIKHKVSRLICLSTDKAVYPINAMGMTKALMEKVAQSAARGLNSETVVCAVRYGNVMHSRGSVIPLFVKQIMDGRPLTVTEPSMTRFLLTLPNAIDLVLYAMGNGRPGDVLIRKSPACTMGDLAIAIKQLFAAKNPIQVIGIRHGEKIYETLATREELRRAEDMGDYYRVSMDGRDLNYSKYVSEGDSGNLSQDDYTSHNTKRLTVPEVEALLRTLPEIRLALDSARQR